MRERVHAEEGLVNRLVLKDHKAWKELYDSYSAYLTSVCRRYVRCQDTVRDVLQEAFVQMFKSISAFEYRGSGSLKAWIHRITVNECLRHLRARRGLYFPELPEELAEEEPEVSAVPEEVLLEMISSLPEGYRVVFNLYVLEGRSHGEIAALLHISEGTSASQFHRAKKILAQKIIRYQNTFTHE
ncbi:RNA polymerase, sigma-24 subunit, ECF subfamily [Leadbetterella byssophila DSM 17132]|uniref:RNA polymerase, sigma-24 subunit, ECF subfamily n=1 Tax=Leadbetterella byssophila (strain DSM 17132 / JCM 16389 / KACC 11308 / NBRC 106382 / 4M15) TaxID=649349 RepID=E4RXQ1_LEAB4|nr:RNA polymerase sigma factor [Leadbetterella byssophila]ADQ18115.1 RNA polymerase, sigma-24 subunit, ECF subfamily [Leadbetterella byssophila DSM 17132]